MQATVFNSTSPALALDAYIQTTTDADFSLVITQQQHEAVASASQAAKRSLFQAKAQLPVTTVNTTLQYYTLIVL